MTGPAPTRAEIVVDVAALRHNVRRLSEVVNDGAAPTPVRMMTVVKADGYGHGLSETARAAREAGADWLGVATIEEALAVRAAGDTGRVLCWLTTPSDDLTEVVAADVDVTAYSLAELDQAVGAGEQAGTRPRVQIKVDTGLSRGGAPRSAWADLFAAAAGLEQDGRLTITGIWTHPACADDPDHPANDAQEAAFRDALALAEAAGLRPEVRHFANSAAAVLRPSARFDLVRCGIASYGLDPAPGRTPDLGLVPAMTVRAELAMVKHLQAGDGVSYGHRWVAPGPTTVGLVPVGYADGAPRSASNRAFVTIAGQQCPVRGTICMDQLVVDLGQVPAEAGDDVVLFGSGADGGTTAQDWAAAAGTINYEIVTRVGGRLGRRHVDTERGPRGTPPDTDHEEHP
ncbi:MAG: alanine racemase [Nocardioides sp.]|nr:alanine racemase [Nocardioides sp.]